MSDLVVEWEPVILGARESSNVCGIAQTTGMATPDPSLRFGSRGEGITYRDGEREAFIEFTYGGGPRIYTHGLRAWAHGPAFTADERREVLGQAVDFVRGQRQAPIIVINEDDPHAPEWRRICRDLGDRIAAVETTSDAGDRASYKKMLMYSLDARRGVNVEGVVLETEAEIDQYLDRLYPRRIPHTDG